MDFLGLQNYNRTLAATPCWNAASPMTMSRSWSLGPASSRRKRAKQASAWKK
jgi:hypothetical protein